MQLDPRDLPPPNLSFRQRASTKLLMGILLLATVAGGTGGLILVAMGGGQPDVLEMHPDPGRLPQRMLLLALCGLANSGCAVAMWSFRRWGVYGVLSASLVAFVINFKMGGIPVAVPGLIAVACATAFALAAWVEFD
jgi:hypothetical protein